MTHIEAQVEQIRRTAASAIERLATKYWHETLLPFCRKHHLTYMAGNGMWTFYDRRGDSLDQQDLPISTLAGDLDLEIFGRNDLFGFYLNDVRKSDLRLRQRQ